MNTECLICKTPLPEEPPRRGPKRKYCSHRCACTAHRRREFDKELERIEEHRRLAERHINGGRPWRPQRAD